MTAKWCLLSRKWLLLFMRREAKMANAWINRHQSKKQHNQYLLCHEPRLALKNRRQFLSRLDKSGFLCWPGSLDFISPNILSRISQIFCWKAAHQSRQGTAILQACIAQDNNRFSNLSQQRPFSASSCAQVCDSLSCLPQNYHEAHFHF